MFIDAKVSFSGVQKVLLPGCETRGSLYKHLPGWRCPPGQGCVQEEQGKGIVMRPSRSLIGPVTTCGQLRWWRGAAPPGWTMDGEPEVGLPIASPDVPMPGKYWHKLIDLSLSVFKEKKKINRSTWNFVSVMTECNADVHKSKESSVHMNPNSIFRFIKTKPENNEKIFCKLCSRSIHKSNMMLTIVIN